MDRDIMILIALIIFCVVLMCILCVLYIYMSRKSYIRTGDIKKLNKRVSNMEYKSEFDAIYTRLIDCDINGIRKEKLINFFKKIVEISPLVSIIIAVIYVFFNLYMQMFHIFNGTEYGKNNYINTLTFVILLLLVVNLLMQIFYPINYLKYKNGIIKKLIYMIRPSIKYISTVDKSKEKNALDEVYNKAKFRVRSNNWQKITDYMEYELYNGENVILYDLHVKKHIYRGGTHNIYEGLIAKISRNQRISNEVLIESCEKNKKATDDEFDQYFNIVTLGTPYTNIVNSYIKSELVRLYKETGMMFEIYTDGKDIYMRFFTGSMFENKFFIPTLSKKKLYKEYIIFTNILDIIQKVNQLI